MSTNTLLEPQFNVTNPLNGLFFCPTTVKLQQAYPAFNQLPPILRVILSADGTVTSILESYLWCTIKVDVLAHETYILDHDENELDSKRGESVLMRQVILKNAKSGTPYAFAESYSRPDRLWHGVQNDLIQGRLGIGEVLKKKETVRHIYDITYGTVDDLSDELEIGREEKAISRNYSISYGGKPIMVIKEVFPVSRLAI
ncbi:MAG: chorismate-pyruvate lyase [Lentimonas sp.]|jgi:chorismate-pyruvate lyase